MSVPRRVAFRLSVLGKRLDAYWFGPEPAVNLGASRLLYCGLLLATVAISQDNADAPAA